MANSQSAYKKRPNILSSLSVLVRKRIELLFQTKGDIQGSLKYLLLVPCRIRCSQKHTQAWGH